MMFSVIYYLELLLHLLILNVFFNYVDILIFYNVQTSSLAFVDKECVAQQIVLAMCYSN